MKKITELCPNCNKENEINENGGYCKYCHTYLKPCSQCDMDIVDCKHCRFDCNLKNIEKENIEITELKNGDFIGIGKLKNGKYFKLTKKGLYIYEDIKHKNLITIYDMFTNEFLKMLKSI